MQFHSNRSFQVLSENEEQHFIEDLPSIVIRFWPIKANCTLFLHWVHWIDKQSDPEYYVSSPDSGSLQSIY